MNTTFKSCPVSPLTLAAPAPLTRLAVDDRLLLLIGSVVAILIGSIAMSGWPAGLLPDIQMPYQYSGDALSSMWLTERAMEGWVFDNPRSGFPFGSSFLDYPGADNGSFLILKLLGWLGGTSAAAMNLFYLLGFAVNFAIAHLVIRSVSVSRPMAFTAAMVFAIAPFHFLRLGHIFYTWYFVIPLYFYVAFAVVSQARHFDFFEASNKRRAGLALLYLAMSCFGVYYTAFGMIVIGTAAGLMLLRGCLPPLRGIVAPALFFLALGSLANVLPNIVHERTHGKNAEVAARSPVESEIYATKPLQLVLPQGAHRSEKLAAIAQHYNSSTPLINENVTAALGFLGAAGLGILVLVLFTRFAGVTIDERLNLLSATTIMLLAFMIVGGLGSLFANLVSPSIRGWNRASIFVSFSTILALVVVVEYGLARVRASQRRYVAGITAMALLAFGFWDQTPNACRGCDPATRAAYTMDKSFVADIERALPEGAAVYQLPYMPFPEVPPLHELQTYGLAAGFIHSTQLKWSYAGMKGREGDLYFRQLSTQPVDAQLAEIRRKGFCGVYIDTRGYPDSGAAEVAAWSAALGHGPNIEREDGKVVFFDISATPGTPAGTPAN
jgi:phosphoglycerol transferase